MTPVRRLAIKIVDAAVRHAPQANREWAEGVAHELDYIKSDWSALRWAMGSVRVLLVRRQMMPRLPRTLDVVRKMAINNANKSRDGLMVLWCPTFGGLYYAWHFFNVKNQVIKVGCALAVLFAICSCALFVVTRRRIKDPAEEEMYEDNVASALFYRAELERSGRDKLVAGVVFGGFFVGMQMARDWTFGTDTFFDIMFLIFFLRTFSPMPRRTREAMKRLIARIDQLLGEQS